MFQLPESHSWGPLQWWSLGKSKSVFLSHMAHGKLPMLQRMAPYSHVYVDLTNHILGALQSTWVQMSGYVSSNHYLWQLLVDSEEPSGPLMIPEFSSMFTFDVPGWVWGNSLDLEGLSSLGVFIWLLFFCDFCQHPKMPECFFSLLYVHKCPLEWFPTAGLLLHAERLEVYVVILKKGNKKERNKKQGMGEGGGRE